MNILLHIGISIFLWFYLIRSVINNSGLIGSFIHKIGNTIFPNGVFTLSGPFFILILLFIVYVFLFYIAIWKSQPSKE